MLVTNFGGLMVVPIDPPYCLCRLPSRTRTTSTLQVVLLGYLLALACHTLLQHADLTEAHRWKYNGSHLIVPQGAQYKTLLPEITMLRVPTDSPNRKSSCHSKCSPQSKEQRDKHEKGSHSLSVKHKDKPRSDRSSKDKEGNKSHWKHPMSLPQQLSSTERAGKEPHLEEPSWTLSVNSEGCHQSPSRCLGEMDDKASFVGPTSTSIPNKTGVGHAPAQVPMIAGAQ